MWTDTHCHLDEDRYRGQGAKDLGGTELVALIEEDTHTCYLGDRTHRHAWGYGCGECPACVLRARGYERFVATV